MLCFSVNFSSENENGGKMGILLYLFKNLTHKTNLLITKSTKRGEEENESFSPLLQTKSK
jgi:hypothetical protein